MLDKQVIIDQACLIIRENIGEQTAEMYRRFYNKQEPGAILLSLKELLSELVGPDNANRQLASLRALNKNNKQSNVKA